MALTFEQVAKDFEEIKNTEKIKKLMTRHENYFTAFQMKKCLEMWAKRDDCLVEVPWGCYDDIKGVERYLLTDHGDRNDPEVQEIIKGCVVFRTVDTELVVIAGDGQTARACWSSQGFEVYGNNVFQKEYKGETLLYFLKYGVDSIKEDGEWKLWHMHIYPQFRVPYHTGWTDREQPFQGHILRSAHCDRPPSIPVFCYSLKTSYPGTEPDPPLAYETFADVAPGYGYKF